MDDAGRVPADPLGRKPSALELDVPATVARLAGAIVESMKELGRRGAVVAVSGGIDSSVVAGLCVRALGPERVICLSLPEREGESESTSLGRDLAQGIGARWMQEPISAALDALGCYERRDEAIRTVFPDYEPGWPHKLVRSAPTGAIIVFSLVLRRPDGHEEERRMPPDAYRALIAATNMKQRVRKLLEYTWADRLGYAVMGTPNLLEYDQGFFVKGGDGLADVKPIAGLYKSQVYDVARELGLPAAILARTPTTDTFSLSQTQEEFYFGHPHERMDLLLWGSDEGVPAAELAPFVDLPVDAVESAYWEVARRREATRYLHATAMTFARGHGGV